MFFSLLENLFSSSSLEPSYIVASRKNSYASVCSELSLFSVLDYSLESPPAVCDDATPDVTGVPWLVSGIAVTYNIPEVLTGGLKISRAALVDIVVGNITTWNDPAIVTLNPSLQLPNKQTFVLYFVVTRLGQSMLSGPLMQIECYFMELCYQNLELLLVPNG